MTRILRFVAPALLLLVALLAAPAAGAAPDGGNSDAAKACQNGGYAKYTRTDGTRFANTGECVSYAARGGTLVVPLPDLKLNTSCVPNTVNHSITCTFTVTNIGVAPATGSSILLEALATAQGNNINLAGQTTCTFVDDPANPPTYSFPPGSAGGQSIVTCAGPLNPGEQLSATVTVGVGTPNAGAPLTISAAVDPNNIIQESNENNNTYSAVIPAP